MTDKELPDYLKVMLTQRDDKDEVTFVQLECTGEIMLAAEYDAAVDRWKRGLSRKIRTVAFDEHKTPIRALAVCIRTLNKAIPDEEVARGLVAKMLTAIADDFSITEKSAKDMLRRYPNK